MVKFKTLVAEVGLAVGAALGGLQRLRRLAEAAHDGYAAQAQRVSVPEGCTYVQRDKCRVREAKKKKKSFKDERKEVIFIAVCSKLVRFLAWIRGQQPATSHVLLCGGGGKRLQPLPG